MIEKIQKKKYDILLCHELSRLSRNPIDNGVLVHLLDTDCLQAIQTPTSIYTNIPNDKFTLALFLNVAKFENDQRGKNTASGMQNSKAKGGTTNRANMGYKNAGTTK
jgi:DNA invertase Pin-like site-specific DNA recombinase